MNGSDPGSALGVMPTPKKEGSFVHDLLNSTRDLLLILLRVPSSFVPLCFELRPNPRVDEPTSDGRTKFIATIIAFHCLSLEQNGIMETRVPRNAKIVSQNGIADSYVVQEGSELDFPEKEGRKGFKVKLGEVISRDPAMIGRSTVVLNATSDKWQIKGKDIPLVVKISWPTSNREAETRFLKKASTRGPSSTFRICIIRRTWFLPQDRLWRRLRVCLRNPSSVKMEGSTCTNDGRSGSSSRSGCMRSNRWGA